MPALRRVRPRARSARAGRSPRGPRHHRGLGVGANGGPADREGSGQGATRKVAVKVAARLGAALPVETVLALLQDGDPEVRAEACRCAGPWPAVLQALLGLAADGERETRLAAACALGRLGRHEARPALGRLLRDAPSVEVIEAIPAVADEDCIILLGRIARTRPTLAGAARDALELIDHPRARQIVAAMPGRRDESG